MKNLTIKIKSILLIICGSVLLYSIIISLASCSAPPELPPRPVYNKEVPKVLHGTWITESVSLDQGKTFKNANMIWGVMNSDSFMPLGGDTPQIIKTISTTATKKTTDMIELRFYSGIIWQVMVSSEIYPHIMFAIYSNEEDFKKQKEKIKLLIVINK